MKFTEYNSLKNQFKQQLNEAEKIAVFSFGRFNPPTKGHERLFNVLKETAITVEGDSFVFPSHSVDSKKNPLTFEQKITFLRELFPDINFIDNCKCKHPWDVVSYLYEMGYKKALFVVGSDRIDEFQRLVKFADDFFESFELVNAGTRDPDSLDITGMSATRAREVAKSNNLANFRAATGWNGMISEYLFEAVKNGLSLKEDKINE